MSIGDEILNGRICDTNSAYLGSELLSMSLAVSHQRCTSDAPGQLMQQLQELAPNFDLIISSGGLGPTADDRVLDEITKLGLTPTALNNPAGSADGAMVVLEGGCRYIALPGPPIECHQTFAQSVKPILSKLFPDVLKVSYHTMHFIGTTESNLADRISALFEETANPQLGITASEQGVTISLLARPDAKHTADYYLQRCREEITEKLQQWLWGEGDITLAKSVVELARELGVTLACAESCTGGQVAAAIVDIPGASQVFHCSWVTYSDEAKQQRLGVDAGLIEQYGAVSEEVACAMAVGARNKSKSDYAVSVTGVAGPGGGTLDKPVGTVCLAIAGADGVYSMTRQQYILGGRPRIQRQSVRDALHLLFSAMQGRLVLR
ncbi:MAG: nicotinamide-nucleotide amidase [Myxococcota bacterium]|jgi:nicotinamide-nucleotide amidase